MSMTLRQLLRSRREELGYSRTRASQLSGVNANTIEAWEVGRVLKPPIQDVIRLARVLSISLEELEQAAMQEDGSGDRGGPGTELGERAAVSAAAKGVGLPLLARAMDLLAWNDRDAAQALSTSSARIRRLRGGADELSVLEAMTLIAMLAAIPPRRGGATQPEVDELLALLRRPRVG